MLVSDSSTQRGRGRPSASSNSQQRQRLLQAARELLAKADDGELALRQVALRAGVSPALAHYYFTNRHGLLTALIDAHIAPEIEVLIRTVEARAAQPVPALTILMQRLVALAANDNTLSRCLLLAAGRPLRERLRALLRDLLQGAQAAGALRADLTADYLAEALLGMCLFPLLDPRAGGNTNDHAAALMLQHVALLQDGIVRAQRPRQDSGS